MTSHPNRNKRPLSSTERSRRQLEKAALVLPPIALDADHAAALQKLVSDRGGTRAALIRSLIMSAAGKYLQVGVRHRSGRMVRRYVHRLVAELWNGCLPEGMDACHNDGNPLNNAASNIRWDTRSGNHADKVRHGTNLDGEQNPMARLTRDQVVSIRARIAAGVKQAELAREYGVSPNTISRIARNHTWRSV